GIVRRASPESVFIQLQSLVDDASEHHRAETSISNGKRANPFGIGRSPIPETQVRHGRRHISDELQSSRHLRKTRCEKYCYENARQVSHWITVLDRVDISKRLRPPIVEGF